MHTDLFMCCAPLVALLMVATHAIGRDMKGKNVHNNRHDEISAKTIEIETVVEESEGQGYQTLFWEPKTAPLNESNLLKEKLCEQKFRTQFS